MPEGGKLTRLFHMVTNKADAEQYYALANKNMELIRQTVSKRSRPNKPTD